MKISSKFIWSFIRFTWNLTAYSSVIFGVWINAPPIFRIVAASGTNKTLYPIYLRWISRVDKAVVLPAQGPPVRQILVMGPLLPFSRSRWLAEVTIGSSIPIILERLDRESTSYCLSWANWFLIFSFISSSTCLIAPLLKLLRLDGLGWGIWYSFSVYLWAEPLSKVMWETDLRSFCLSCSWIYF